ncbi:MAG: Gldg family protein [Acidiferrobacterales bacterium]|nr:Gldg family protein [Acidiferrobacterales bacterium]
MSSKWLTATGLVLAVVLLLAVNILSNAAFTSMRADLTEGKLYTLTKGTRNMLAGLVEPVRLRLFLSERLATRLPRINSYAKRVRELLAEYERAADGKLTVEVIDPEPFSPQEDRAVGYGLRGIPLDEESTFYFGLVATGSTDQEEMIPYLTIDREEFLEYDISRLIYQVANPKQKVVGLMSWLPLTGNPRAAMMGRRPQEWMVLEQVRQLFDVKTLEENISEIPADVDVLMVVHPTGLKDETLYAIDQFVLRGGRALIFADPHPEADQGPPTPMAETTRAGRGSELSKLFDVWGVELVPGKVVGDLQLATRVQFEHEGRLVMLDYPVWINLPPELYNRDDIVTASLIGPLRLGTPGQLLKKDGASTQFSPLLESTVNAALIGTEKLGIFSDPQDVARDYKPDGKRYVLAARLTGPVTSAFADGPPQAGESKTSTEDKKAAADEKATPKHEHLAKSKQDINVIVVADTDLLQDTFWVQVQDFLGNRIAIPNAANGALVVNALDNLTGSNDLIGIRSRGRFTRPFTRVNALRQEAELRFRQKEQELISRLEETERKLAELERSKQESAAMVLSEAQQQEIASFRQEKVRIRNELRDVRHELRKNIETLEGWLKFINIGMMPILIGIGGVVVGSYQIRRRKKGVRRSAHTG